MKILKNFAAFKHLELTFKHLVLALIFMVGGPLSFYERASAEVIDEFFPKISRLSTIRVGVVAAPGNGHQSASANIVYRLRAMGYKGEIEIVYDEGVSWRYIAFSQIQMKNAEKMHYLLPPFSPNGGKLQIYESQKLKFISKSYFDKNKESFIELPFGIMGADDYKMNPKNYRVQTLLTLQPYRWREQSTLAFTHNKPPSWNKKIHIKTLSELDDLGVYINLQEPDDVSEFIKNQMSHTPELAEKISGLNTIVDSLERLDLAPAYGHYMNSGQALLYVGGILKALNSRPDLFERGVVLPMLNAIDSDMKHFYRSKFQEGSFRDVVQVADISDEGLPEQIKNLQKGQILIVFTGPVAKPVFEYLYNKSTLPPTVEGMNSIDLMRQIGRPYLPTEKREGFFFSHNNQILKSVEGTFMLDRQSVNGLRSADKLPSEKEYNDIAQFIIESREINSEISNIFLNNVQNTSDLRFDKIFAGLEAAEKIVSDSKADIEKFISKSVVRDVGEPFTPHEWLDVETPEQCSAYLK